ncbi:MAG: type II secretion system GspH family protein [Opitutaceae bacterium]|jgi:prepilin-type N-terminal cleavage/methylation domain-containing protein/prepilin-type processing-associated H-X9-DG protein|nr:type II secretion system GspH family protein [Opitutaceae bacterium]
MKRPLKNRRGFIRIEPRAFTLVELLVVIAIIGVLAGIIIPVASTVRSTARQAESLSNVRQVTLAVLLYANDNKDHLPYYNGDLSDSSIWDRTMMEPYLAKKDPVWSCPVVLADYQRRAGWTDADKTWKGRIRTSWQLTGGGASWYIRTGRPNPHLTKTGILTTSFVSPSQSLLAANFDHKLNAGYKNSQANAGFADGSAKRVRDDTWLTPAVAAEDKPGPGVFDTYIRVNANGLIRGYDY